MRFLVLLALSGPALAGTVSHPFFVQPIHNYDAVTAVIPGFDTSLGHLDSITYDATLSATGTFSFENVTPLDFANTVDLSSTVSSLVTVYNHDPLTLTPFDGTIDYAGTSGVVLSFSAQGTWTTTIPLGLDAGVFGQPFANVSFWASPGIYGIPNDSYATAQVDVWSTLHGTITYTYSDWPFEYCTENMQGVCPCGAPFAAMACPNSATQYGARLFGYGDSSISGSGMTFTASTFLPGTTGVLFEGTTAISPVQFGDGIRCVGGTIRRLSVSQTIANNFAYPPVVHGAATGFRAYQYWYRNAAQFCTPAVFNMTSAQAVVWKP